MAIRAKFKPTPEGEFHPGIPSRDLTDEDYDALSTNERKTVRESRLYDYRPERDTAAERVADKPAPAGEGKG